jgi:hypothetical protein
MNQWNGTWGDGELQRASDCVSLVL